MGFDVTLVDHAEGELAVDDQISLGESGVDVANFVEHFGRNIAGLFGGRAVGFGGVEVLDDDRGVRLHRVPDLEDRVEHFVLDVDQLEGLGGDMRVGGRHGGDGVAVVVNLAAREHVGALEFKRKTGRFAAAGELVARVGEGGAGNDCANTVQGLGAAGVDADDAGMGVRAAQDLAMQLAGQVDVGTVARFAGDLFEAVVANRPGSNDLVFLVVMLDGLADSGVYSHGYASARMRSAASRTARTILS